MKPKQLKKLLILIAFTTGLIGVTPAYAATYKAGSFRITLGEHPRFGKTYKGCDAKNKCINLKNGTGWRDKGYRGTIWENGEYAYSISWREDSNNLMYLSVSRNGKRIMRRKLVPIPMKQR